MVDKQNVDELKQKLCKRGSPKILLERLKVDEPVEEISQVSPDVFDEEEEEYNDKQEDDNCFETSYEEKVIASIVAVGPAILKSTPELNKSIDFSESDPEVKEMEVEDNDEEEKVAEESPESDNIDNGDGDYEDDEDEYEEKVETPKRSSTPLRQSPRTKNISPKSDSQTSVRRSARERRTFRCPIKSCEKKPVSKVEEMMRHINVNHPSHYAAVIVRKHSLVFKVCSQVCGY